MEDSSQPCNIGIEAWMSYDLEPGYDHLFLKVRMADDNIVDLIDASGQAVAPGFVNMLSRAVGSLLEDGRGLNNIKQGVTLEVMGEGGSMGPLNDKMKQTMLASQGDIKYDVTWTTLGGYLSYLEEKGISTNVASFVGAATLRIHEMGYEDRVPTPEELANMTSLTAQAMEEGAMGVGSSLIYAPGFYTGYGVKTLPGVREAIEQSEFDQVETQINILASVINGFSSKIDKAISLMK